MRTKKEKNYCDLRYFLHKTRPVVGFFYSWGILVRHMQPRPKFLYICSSNNFRGNVFLHAGTQRIDHVFPFKVFTLKTVFRLRPSLRKNAV